MVLSLIGMTASAIYISILANYRLHPAYLLVAPVLSSLTGGWTILLMAMFSFVGDYTIDRVRDIRNEQNRNMPLAQSTKWLVSFQVAHFTSQ